MASSSDFLLNSDDDSSFENIDDLAADDARGKPNPIVNAALENLFPEEYAIFEAAYPAGLKMPSLDEITAAALANMLNEGKPKAVEKTENTDDQQSAEAVKDKKKKSDEEKKAKKAKKDAALRLAVAKETRSLKASYVKALFFLVLAMGVLLKISVYKMTRAHNAEMATKEELLEAARIPTSKPLDFTFPVGRRVSIVGVPTANASRFHVDFLTASGDIAFHFNPRFEEKVMVMNHAVNGHWNYDLEKRKEEWKYYDFESKFPFTQAKMFDLDFYNKGDIIEVRVNKKFYCDFDVRTPSFTDAVQLSIGGDVAIYAIKDKPKPREITPDYLAMSMAAMFA